MAMDSRTARFVRPWAGQDPRHGLDPSQKGRLRMEQRRVAERRDFPRIGVTFSLTIAFLGGEREGNGILMNLSHAGCAIQSSNRVEEGGCMLLHIHPPDGEPPIMIETAEVKWINGQDFGVEFLTVAPEEEERVLELLHVLRTKYNVAV